MRQFIPNLSLTSETQPTPKRNVMPPALPVAHPSPANLKLLRAIPVPVPSNQLPSMATSSAQLPTPPVVSTNKADNTAVSNERS